MAKRCVAIECNRGYQWSKMQAARASTRSAPLQPNRKPKAPTGAGPPLIADGSSWRNGRSFWRANPQSSPQSYPAR